jgi:hypothetical protein
MVLTKSARRAGNKPIQVTVWSCLEYPLQSGIRDAIAYYYAGSLTDAMLGLVEKTGSDAQANRANPAETRKRSNRHTEQQQAIILDEKSQVCFHKLMIKAGVRKGSLAQRRARTDA